MSSLRHLNILDAKPRVACHMCSNIRTRQLTCVTVDCPHVFCNSCANKMRTMHGQDVFARGCPMCLRLCCCAKKSFKCPNKFHCYKKCPCFRPTPTQTPTHTHTHTRTAPPRPRLGVRPSDSQLAPTNRKFRCLENRPPHLLTTSNLATHGQLAHMARGFHPEISSSMENHNRLAMHVRDSEFSQIDLPHPQSRSISNIASGHLVPIVGRFCPHEMSQPQPCAVSSLANHRQPAHVGLSKESHFIDMPHQRSYVTSDLPTSSRVAPAADATEFCYVDMPRYQSYNTATLYSNGQHDHQRQAAPFSSQLVPGSQPWPLLQLSRPDPPALWQERVLRYLKAADVPYSLIEDLRSSGYLGDAKWWSKLRKGFSELVWKTLNMPLQAELGYNSDDVQHLVQTLEQFLDYEMQPSSNAPHALHSANIALEPVDLVLEESVSVSSNYSVSLAKSPSNQANCHPETNERTPQDSLGDKINEAPASASASMWFNHDSDDDQDLGCYHFGPQPTLTLASVCEAARWRWLSNEEIATILGNPVCLAFPVSVADIKNPKSGTLLLYSRLHFNFSQEDGINWIKNREDNTLREGLAKLYIGGRHVITCFYCRSEDNRAFHRRTYKLSDKAGGFYLVHYLDEAKMTAPRYQRHQSHSPTASVSFDPDRHRDPPTGTTHDEQCEIEFERRVSDGDGDDSSMAAAPLFNSDAVVKVAKAPIVVTSSPAEGQKITNIACPKFNNGMGGGTADEEEITTAATILTTLGLDT